MVSGGPAAVATFCDEASARRSGRSLRPTASAVATAAPIASAPASSTLRESRFGDGGLARMATCGAGAGVGAGAAAFIADLLLADVAVGDHRDQCAQQQARAHPGGVQPRRTADRQ